MMHAPEDRLYDYIDDLLCREERAELESHLAACAECTAFVRRERELRRALAELPRTIAPPPELLEAIHARIDSPTARPLRERTLWSVRYPLAAAALVLVIATALVMRLAQPAPTSTVAAPAAAAVVREVLDAEPRYVDAAAELEAVLQASRAQLRPETIALVERSLRVIDAALAEARSALREDPSNASLAELLRAAHEQKLELLRRATRTTGTT